MPYKPGDIFTLYVDQLGQATNSRFTRPRDACGQIDGDRGEVRVRVIGDDEDVIAELTAELTKLESAAGKVIDRIYPKGRGDFDALENDAAWDDLYDLRMLIKGPAKWMTGCAKRQVNGSHNGQPDTGQDKPEPPTETAK